MLIMRTTEDPTDPIRKLIRSKQPLWLDDLALAVYPLRLYGVQPRTLLRKKAADDPHSLAALFDLAVMFSEPPPELPGDVPACALSQMSSRIFLPTAWSFSQHHPRN